MTQLVYAVLERNADDPETRSSLSKLFTRRGPAERWASIMEDESDTLVLYGKENIRYSYTVVPWEVHDE